MKKHLKLLAIPLAITVMDGCVPFHNALRNIRHNIEDVARKKDPHYQRPLAHGFSCAGSLEQSIRTARNQAKQELRNKGLEGVIETIPEEAPKNEWPNSYNDSDRTRSFCAIAVAYPTPLTPKPALVAQVIEEEAGEVQTPIRD